MFNPPETFISLEQTYSTYNHQNLQMLNHKQF